MDHFISIIQIQNIHLESIGGIIEYCVLRNIHVKLFIMSKLHTLGWDEYYTNIYGKDVLTVYDVEKFKSIQELNNEIEDSKLINMASHSDLEWTRKFSSPKIIAFMNFIQNHNRVYITAHDKNVPMNKNYIVISSHLYKIMNSAGYPNVHKVYTFHNRSRIPIEYSNKSITICIIGKFRDDNRDISMIVKILEKYPNIRFEIYTRSHLLQEDIVKLSEKWFRINLHIDSSAIDMIEGIRKCHFVTPLINHEKDARYITDPFPGCVQEACWL